MNSRSIGKVVEREACRWLRQWRFNNGEPVQARRAKQSDGKIEPDIWTNIPWARFEISRDEDYEVGTLAWQKKWRKCLKDKAESGDERDVIFMWRRTNSKSGWKITFEDHGYPVTLMADDFMRHMGFER